MLSAGQRIGRYEVLGLVGVGGIASVYRVRHLELGSIHALKLLGVHREQIAARLLQEGQAQATLQHPNVVRVHDVATFDGAPVLVMEYVDGGTLLQLVERSGRLPLGLALDLSTGITRGLQAAHDRGLVHRDLKLANVLLAPTTTRGYVPKLADFGLVKIMAAAGGGHTRVGAAMGTAEYMPPEQMRDASRVDPRADLYALGCVIHALLTGHLPYRAPDLPTLHRKIVSRDRPPLDHWVPGLPAAVVGLVDRLLEPDPAARPANAAEVLAALSSPEVWVPRGPTTLPPTEVVAATLRAGAAWDAIHGPDVASAARRAPVRVPGAGALLLLPALAAALGLAVPAPRATPAPAVVAAPAPEDAAPEAPAPVASEAPVPPPSIPPPASPPTAAPRPAAPAIEPAVPPPPAPPARARVAVSVVGDATRVWLRRQGRRVDLPGSLSPGKYEIVAVFPGTEPATAGEVEVGDLPVTVNCSAFARRCRAEAR